MILLLEKTINNFLGNIIIKRDWRLNSCFSSLLSVVVQFGARYNILHPALNLHLISFSEVASLLVPPASGFSKLEVSQSGWHLKIHQCAECWVMGGWHNIRTPMGWHQHVQTSWKYLALGPLSPLAAERNIEVSVCCSQNLSLHQTSSVSRQLEFHHLLGKHMSIEYHTKHSNKEKILETTTYQEH
jgi:hypothetical protein